MVYTSPINRLNIEILPDIFIQGESSCFTIGRDTQIVNDLNITKSKITNCDIYIQGDFNPINCKLIDCNMKSVKHKNGKVIKYNLKERIKILLKGKL